MRHQTFQRRPFSAPPLGEQFLLFAGVVDGSEVVAVAPCLAVAPHQSDFRVFDQVGRENELDAGNALSDMPAVERGAGDRREVDRASMFSAQAGFAGSRGMGAMVETVREWMEGLVSQYTFKMLERGGMPECARGRHRGFQHGFNLPDAGGRLPYAR